MQDPGVYRQRTIRQQTLGSAQHQAAAVQLRSTRVGIHRVEHYRASCILCQRAAARQHRVQGARFSREVRRNERSTGNHAAAQGHRRNGLRGGAQRQFTTVYCHRARSNQSAIHSKAQDPVVHDRPTSVSVRTRQGHRANRRLGERARTAQDRADIAREHRESATTQTSIRERTARERNGRRSLTVAAEIQHAAIDGDRTTRK